MMRISQSQMLAFEDAHLLQQRQELLSLCRDHYPKTFAPFDDVEVTDVLRHSLKVSQQRGGVENHWSLVKLAAIQANSERILENPPAKLYFKRQVNRGDAEWEKVIDEMHLNLYRYFPEAVDG